MNFRQLTEHQSTLRAQVAELEKSSSVVGAMFRGSKRLGGPVLGPMMFGAGALGTVGVAGSALGKSREYSRGFDPRIQELKLRGHKF